LRGVQEFARILLSATESGWRKSSAVPRFRPALRLAGSRSRSATAIPEPDAAGLLQVETPAFVQVGERAAPDVAQASWVAGELLLSRDCRSKISLRTAVRLTPFLAAPIAAARICQDRPPDPDWRVTDLRVPATAAPMHCWAALGPLPIGAPELLDRARIPAGASGAKAPPLELVLSPLKLTPRRSDPAKAPTPKPSPFPIAVLERWWKSASMPVRVALVGAPLACALAAIVPRSVTHETSRLVRERAAIELADDFSGGLRRWGGADDWKFDPAGWVSPGRLATFRPAAALSDYRIEFRGQIIKKSLSWAFRVADSRNYYAMKITITRPGPLSRASLLRYTVAEGVAGPRAEAALPFDLRSNTVYHVVTSVYQDRFVTSVNGQIVDSFSDGRHTAGGVGLFRESGESWRVLSFRVADHDDFLGRACAYLSGDSADRKTGRTNEN